MSLRGLLFKGLENVLGDEEFEEKKEKVLDRAFREVIEGTYEGRIKWKRDVESKEPRYTARAEIENAAGEKIEIPIEFYVNDRRIGKLRLGDDDELSRCTYNLEIRKFGEEVFGIRYFREPIDDWEGF